MTHGPYPPPQPPRRETSGKAVASLVISVVGLVTCAFLGIVGIIIGNSALSDIRASGGMLEGEGLARAGVIIGWINVALLGVGCLFGVVFFIIMMAGAATIP